MNFYFIDPNVININSWDALLTALDIEVIIDLNIYQPNKIDAFTCYHKVFNKIKTKHCLNDFRRYYYLEKLTPEERGKCYKKAIQTVFSPFTNLVIEKYHNVISQQPKENWNVLVLADKTSVVENTIKYVSNYFFSRLGKQCDWGRKFNYKQIREHIDFYILHFKYRVNYRYSYQQQCFYRQHKYMNDKHPYTEKFQTIDGLFKFILEEFRISEKDFYADSKIYERRNSIDYDYDFEDEDDFEYGLPERYYSKSINDNKILDYFILKEPEIEIERNGGFYAYKDKTGKLLTSFIYKVANPFKERLALVLYDNVWNFIDVDFNIIISLADYNHVENFIDGFAKVRNIHNKYGYIDKTGQEIIPCEYDYLGNFSEELAVMRKDERKGFINRSGEETILYGYDGIRDFSNGLAKVSRKNRYGFINKTGQEIIPCEHDFVWGFSNGLVKMKKMGSCGIFNKRGEEVIPFEYSEIGLFSEGLSIVVKRNKYGVINMTGEIVIPCEYENIRNFSEGFAIVKRNEGYGFSGYGLIDKNGKKITPCMYEYFREFFGGLAMVGKYGKYGFIDMTGKKIIPCIYDNAYNNGDSVEVEIGEETFYFNMIGEKIEK